MGYYNSLDDLEKGHIMNYLRIMVKTTALDFF